MQKRLSKYSWLTYLLLIIYFVLHEFNANYGLIPIHIAFELFFRYLLIGIGLHWFTYFIFRDFRQASFYTFILMIFFLFFGSLHDALKSIAINTFIASHVFIFSLMGLLVILMFFIVKKVSQKHQAIISFGGLLVFILFIWEIGKLSYNVISHAEKKNNLAGKISPRKEFFPPQSNFQKPDIFFLVFDGYSSSRRLAEDFQFSNQQLDSLLVAKDFFISRHSRSNYSITPFSIASTLNMNYLSDKVAQTDATAQFLLQGVETLYDSELPILLEEQGYDIYNYSCFNLRDHPALTETYFTPWSERMIDEQTLAGRFKKYLAWNFLVKKRINGKLQPGKLLLRSRDRYISDFISKNIEGLKQAASIVDTTPKFVYCHIVLPHEPYYFRKDGSLFPDSLLVNGPGAKGGYLEQTQYANSIIANILETLMAKNNKPFVIVLEGDHGYRSYELPSDKYKIFDNLNAYYFSDKNYSLLYDSISPVNSFRVVLNKYFDQHFPLLPDSSVYIRDSPMKPGKNE